MKDLHPITIAIIILVSLYLLTGCQSSVSYTKQLSNEKYNTPTGFAKFTKWANDLFKPSEPDYSFRADPHGLKRWNKIYGGRPSGLNYSTPSQPWTWRDQQNNPEERGFDFWF